MTAQQDTGFWDDADVISVYTRRQAIEDGVLVDLGQVNAAMVREAGFRVPIAMTDTVFAEAIGMIDAGRRSWVLLARPQEVLDVLRTSFGRERFGSRASAPAPQHQGAAHRN